MAEEEGKEAVGENTESDEVATFILKRADVVMESWQVANALKRMSQMIPRDKKRRKKLRQAAEYVVANFVDNMAKEHFKETKERGRQWREEVDSQDNTQRTARALGKQQKKEEEEKNKRQKTKRVTTKKVGEEVDEQERTQTTTPAQAEAMN